MNAPAAAQPSTENVPSDPDPLDPLDVANSDAKPSVVNDRKAETETLEVGINGMTCGMCSNSVTQALNSMDGVTSVSVSLAKRSATIQYNPKSVKPDKIKEEIEDIGYEVVAPGTATSDSKANAKAPVGNLSCHCACDVCYCGDNCQCTETLCRGEASSVLNSLGQSPVLVTSLSKASDGSPPSSRDSSLPRVTLDEKPSSVASSNFSTVEVGVIGMTCSMCSKAVTQALSAKDGVASVSVSLATNSATIHYDKDLVTPEALKEEIEDTGYVAVLPEVTNNSDSVATGIQLVEFAVDGMSCSNCTQAIQHALDGMEGTKKVFVSLSTNSARVEFDAGVTSIEAIATAIEDVGYNVTNHTILTQEVASNQDASGDRLDRLLYQQKKQVEGRKRAFLWSLVGTCPILVFTMILPHLPTNIFEHFLMQRIHIGNHEFVLEALILWALCTPIQFGSGWSFYRTSYFNLRQGVMGMDVLVALGTSASYAYALWATFTGSMDYHFFETSAVLICFVLLGKWLQTLAVRRTSQALTQLLALQPKTAIKVMAPAGSSHRWDPLSDAYQEEVVPLQSIQKGDIVKVLKGSSIPADGLVRFGEMSVDESMITGESVPVLKTQGALVLGGTICAEAGQVAGAAFVEVTGVGSETALSQIVKLVQDAQDRQVPIQDLADTIAGVFVPTVVTISVATFMIWYAAIQSKIVPPQYLPEGESPATFSLLFGIACLVISCPCALGLATPTAVMVGTGVGAKNGVLMKGGETLELASKVDSVIFDKTGTLTKGKPAITDFSVMVTDGDYWDDILHAATRTKPALSTRDHLLWLLGSLERNSEHPLASAVVAYAEQNLAGRFPFVQPTNFVALTGRGASGTIDGRTAVAVGNRAFCALNNIDITRKTEDAMQRLERQGKTAIAAAINGSVCVVLGVADELKEDSEAAIAYLRDEMALDVWMVTGDNRRTARAIAKQLKLPMDRVIAEALPVAKVEKVQELQEDGLVVAMIGDGVNDSPALAQADVGLSLGTGAEIAAEASDMVLVKGKVADVCTALDLSRVIFRRIKLNFLWSLLYNCLSIPIAAGLFYPLIHTRLPPTVAAIAMALSSISVVGSSLALRLYRPPNIRLTNHTPRSSGRRQSRRLVVASGGEDLTEPLLSRDEEEHTERTSNVTDVEDGRAVIVSV